MSDLSALGPYINWIDKCVHILITALVQSLIKAMPPLHMFWLVYESFDSLNQVICACVCTGRTRDVIEFVVCAIGPL